MGRIYIVLWRLGIWDPPPYQNFQWPSVGWVQIFYGTAYCKYLTLSKSNTWLYFTMQMEMFLPNCYLQICLFGMDRFSLVTFLENNHTALKHLFLKDYHSSSLGVVIYTRKELYEHLHYAHEQVRHLFKSAHLTPKSFYAAGSWFFLLGFDKCLNPWMQTQKGSMNEIKEFEQDVTSQSLLIWSISAHTPCLILRL